MIGLPIGKLQLICKNDWIVAIRIGSPPLRGVLLLELQVSSKEVEGSLAVDGMRSGEPFDFTAVS